MLKYIYILTNTEHKQNKNTTKPKKLYQGTPKMNFLKKKILKAAREKRHITYRGTAYVLMQCQKSMEQYLYNIERKTLSTYNLYLVKITFKKMVKKYIFRPTKAEKIHHQYFYTKRNVNKVLQEKGK